MLQIFEPTGESLGSISGSLVSGPRQRGLLSRTAADDRP